MNSERTPTKSTTENSTNEASSFSVPVITRNEVQTAAEEYSIPPSASDEDKANEKYFEVTNLANAKAQEISPAIVQEVDRSSENSLKQRPSKGRIKKNLIKLTAAGLSVVAAIGVLSKNLKESPEDQSTSISYTEELVTEEDVEEEKPIDQETQENSIRYEFSEWADYAFSENATSWEDVYENIFNSRDPNAVEQWLRQVNMRNFSQLIKIYESGETPAGKVFNVPTKQATTIDASAIQSSVPKDQTEHPFDLTDDYVPGENDEEEAGLNDETNPPIDVPEGFEVYHMGENETLEAAVAAHYKLTDPTQIRTYTDIIKGLPANNGELIYYADGSELDENKDVKIPLGGSVLFPEEVLLSSKIR